MTVVAGIMLVRIADETLWCIDDGHRFVKRWEKAMRGGKFFELRHAGRRLLLNPRGITCVQIGVRRTASASGVAGPSAPGPATASSRKGPSC